MKKFVVLTMILAMASLATAGLSLQIGGADAGASVDINLGETVVLQIHSTAEGTTGQYSGILAIPPDAVYPGARATLSITGAAIASEPQVGPDPATGWIVNPYVATFQTNTAANPENFLQAGIGFSFTITGDALGTGKVNLIHDQAGAAPVDSILVNVIPEPMTLGLLGLGGLFLRRKK